MSGEKIIKCFAVYNKKKNTIRSTRQSGRLNVFDWCPYAEQVTRGKDEEVVPIYILIEEKEDE